MFLEKMKGKWEKLIDFIKNKHQNFSVWLKNKHSDYKLRREKKKRINKKKFAKFKYDINILVQTMQIFFVAVVKLLMNIDIGFIFIFMLTYLFNYTYPWYFRLIGSFGMYHVLMSIKQSLKEMRR